MDNNETNNVALAYDEDEDTLMDRYLTFRIGDEDYAIEIRSVTEIIGIQKITEIPNIPNYIKGVINLRGQIIPILSVRLRFGMPEIPFNDRTCIVVIKIRGNDIGIIVDSVAEVMSIPAESITDAPVTNKGSHGKYIYGLGQVGAEVKIIIDIFKLLFDERNNINRKQ